MYYLVKTPEDRFSQDLAHITSVMIVNIQTSNSEQSDQDLLLTVGQNKKCAVLVPDLPQFLAPDPKTLY